MSKDESTQSILDLRSSAARQAQDEWFVLIKRHYSKSNPQGHRLAFYRYLPRFRRPLVSLTGQARGR
jgi:hypothetical protein